MTDLSKRRVGMAFLFPCAFDSLSVLEVSAVAGNTAKYSCRGNEIRQWCGASLLLELARIQGSIPIIAYLPARSDFVAPQVEETRAARDVLQSYEIPFFYMTSRVRQVNPAERSWAFTTLRRSIRQWQSA